MLVEHRTTTVAGYHLEARAAGTIGSNNRGTGSWSRSTVQQGRGTGREEARNSAPGTVADEASVPARD